MDREFQMTAVATAKSLAPELIVLYIALLYNALQDALSQTAE